MSPFETSFVIFCCIFGGAIFGMALRSILPDHHLNAETKEVVKLGVGLVGTMAALLLGLLVASAKSGYDTRGTELTQMAVNTILLDRSLAHYGPQTGEIRGILKVAVTRMIDQVWPKNGHEGSIPAVGGSEILFDKLQRKVYSHALLKLRLR